MPGTSGTTARTELQGGLGRHQFGLGGRARQASRHRRGAIQAIIANRPYKGKDELAQRKIVPQNVYEQIKDKIVARQGTSSSGSSPGSTSPSNTHGHTKSK